MNMKIISLQYMKAIKNNIMIGMSDMGKTYDENHWQSRWRNKTRKLSRIQLTGPSEYEGGGFLDKSW